MKSLEISIQPLTPILTGGADRTTDRLHETGIIGSLRWWYEAIVRGLGGSACDPTEHEHGCKFERDKYDQAIAQGKSEDAALHDSGLCDVCQIFGATGWRRRFDLTIARDETGPAWDVDTMRTPSVDINIRPRPVRTRGWFLPAGRTGDIILRIRGDQETLGSLASLFLFLESWGAIGAKSQLGYGFFGILNRSEIQKSASYWHIIGHEENRSHLPDLRHWLLFRYRFKPSRDDWWTRVKGLQRLLGDRKTAHILSHLAKQGMVPIMPVLKDLWWRAPFSDKRWLLGTSEGWNRVRSKVAVSWAHRVGDVWVVRGWAWVPEGDKVGREVILRRQEIDVFENILRDESIWRNALNLDYACPTDLYVHRLTNSNEVIRVLER